LSDARVVKRVYRITADPVKETEMFKTELERTLNQLMEEEQDSGYITEEQSLLNPGVKDVTDTRAIGTVYKNKNTTMLDVRVSITIS
jgi:anion-transporting  ArsA/GET3 family ATPase